MAGNRSALAAECRQFSRYLIGRNPSEAIVGRYARACEKFAGNALAGDQRIYRFARRHQWALGLLDAACGILDGGNALRKRLLIASAILETTTNHAEVFLPRTLPLGSAVLLLTIQGLKTAGKIVAGIPLYAVVKIL